MGSSPKPAACRHCSLATTDTMQVLTAIGGPSGSINSPGHMSENYVSSTVTVSPLLACLTLQGHSGRRITLPPAQTTHQHPLAKKTTIMTLL